MMNDRRLYLMVYGFLLLLTVVMGWPLIARDYVYIWESLGHFPVPKE